MESQKIFISILYRSFWELGKYHWAYLDLMKLPHMTLMRSVLTEQHFIEYYPIKSKGSKSFHVQIYQENFTNHIPTLYSQKFSSVLKALGISIRGMWVFLFCFVWQKEIFKFSWSILFKIWQANFYQYKSSFNPIEFL